MRITYIHQYFKTPGMAGGTRSYELARRLVARGHEVHMITGAPDGVRAGISTEAGIVVHWLPVPYRNAMSYRRRIWAFLGFVGRSAVVAGRLRHDLVFVTSTPLTVAIPGVYAALRRRVPMVLEVRDVWPELPIALGALRSPVSRWAARRLEAWAYHRRRGSSRSPRGWPTASGAGTRASRSPWCRTAATGSCSPTLTGPAWRCAGTGRGWVTGRWSSTPGRSGW
ncbi:hypothetical protein GCM10023107_06670 [Actinoplanes octamycinicus]|uniref:glycosyltransferase n=1 Tax=Actinoplanes octamycinicus TaxID=135948 RepID=UPI0031ED03C8